MKINLAIFSGARSEYGVLKPLLYELDNNKNIDFKIIVHGMHLLKTFGNTIFEIRKDWPRNKIEEINTCSEKIKNKIEEFTITLNKLNQYLKNEKFDAGFIVGDRLEAYASAMAAHFNNIPIIHSGGGAITNGALDDYYRFNITNISKIHLATSKSCYNRLLQCPLVNKCNVYFVGSIPVEGIKAFKKTSTSIHHNIPKLKKRKFGLLTFHPVTKLDEPTAELMEFSISKILDNKHDILITYPNNDLGYEAILNVIKKWESHPNVYIVKNLGVKWYYSALRDCAFTLGNSSSGIIEAPYFSKPVINIGSRQEGREKDVGIIDVEPKTSSLEKALNQGFRKGWPAVKSNNLYGDGETVKKVIDIITNNFIYAET